MDFLNSSAFNAVSLLTGLIGLAVGIFSHFNAKHASALQENARQTDREISKREKRIADLEHQKAIDEITKHNESIRLEQKNDIERLEQTRKHDREAMELGRAIEQKSFEQTVRAIHSTAISTYTSISTTSPETTAKKIGEAHRALQDIIHITHQTEFIDKLLSNSILHELTFNTAIFNVADLWEKEKNGNFCEFWLFSNDLQPDCSDRGVGKTVANNLKRGIKYVYFYPKSIPDYVTMRLQQNICQFLDDQKAIYAKMVQLVELDDEAMSYLSHRGNIAFMYTDPARAAQPECHEQLVISRLEGEHSRRFWQLHSDMLTNELRAFFSAQLLDA